MYCHKCGNMVAQGTMYCPLCGSRLVSNVQPAPPPPPLDPAIVEDPEKYLRRSFRRKWREMVRSPLFIVSAICISLLHFVLLYALFTVTDALAEGLDTAGFLNGFVNSYEIEEKLETHGFWMTVGKFLLIAGGAISAGGMWLVYSDSNRDIDFSINQNNLIAMKVAQWISAAGAFVFILIFMGIESDIRSLYSDSSGLGVLGDYLSKELDNAIDQRFSVLYAPYWGVLVYNVVMFFVLRPIHNLAASENPKRGSFLFAAIAVFVVALPLLATTGLLGALVAVLGAFMIRCYQENEKLIKEHNEIMEACDKIKAQQKREQPPLFREEKLPTWKRLELEALKQQEQQQQEEQENNKCKNCGEPMNEGQLFCGQCGQRKA